MPRSLPTRWITLLVFGALTALGCVGTTDTGPQGETGSLAVDLVLTGGIEINEVAWQITGNDMDMSGAVDVSAPGSTASVEVFGLPGAMGYTVMLTATSTDEAVTCEGSAPFNVEVGQTTNVMVMLNCKKPRTLGGVRVNGKFNICTELTKAVVSPLQTSVGNMISLSAQAFDEEDDFIHYIWTGDGGSIADPSAASTSYTCQEVGDHTLTILVTDNDVYCNMASWTIPVTCVEGDGGDLCEDVICEDDGNECTETACNPANGACETSNVTDGTDCDGGAGTCSGGQCVAVDLCAGVTCNDTGNDCTVATCNPETGVCDISNVDNGTDCNGDAGMCVDGQCNLTDLCAGVTCDDTGNECTVAECNTQTGQCDTMNVPDGTDCDGGTCSRGECVDNNLCEGVNCASDNDCVQDGTCDPADGLCDPGDPQLADTVCDLTGTDDGFCDGAGTCVECNADVQCPDDGNECTAETCTSDACSSSPVADGTECDADGSAGVCMSGVCEEAMRCADAGTRCDDGNDCTQDLCDPATGECSNPAEADGTQCFCPVCGAEGVCDMGVCIDPCDGVNCADGNQCTADLCDIGICSNPNLGPGSACDQGGGSFCDGTGACVECLNDNQCDVELNETCVDNVCVAAAQACGSQTKTVSVGCTNNVTEAQSPFPFELTVDVASPIAGGGAFSASLDGVGFFPEFFLDAAQGVVCGGLRTAQLVDFVSTVQVRSGATGADVPLGIDLTTLSPGATRFCNFPFDQTCTANGDCLGGVCNPPILLQDLPVLEGTPLSPGGCDADTSNCPTPGPPTDCDCSACDALGAPKDAQCSDNGFCQNGSLVLQMQQDVGNYTADASGNVLFGWSDQGVPGLSICPTGSDCGSLPGRVDGCYQLPPASFANATEPIGIRVNAGGLAVPIQCAMGEDGGTCSTTATQGCLSDADCPGSETCIGIGADDDVICPTPDSVLIACPIN